MIGKQLHTILFLGWKTAVHCDDLVMLRGKPNFLNVKNKKEVQNFSDASAQQFLCQWTDYIFCTERQYLPTKNYMIQNHVSQDTAATRISNTARDSTNLFHKLKINVCVKSNTSKGQQFVTLRKHNDFFITIKQKSSKM